MPSKSWSVAIDMCATAARIFRTSYALTSRSIAHKFLSPAYARHQRITQGVLANELSRFTLSRIKVKLLYSGKNQETQISRSSTLSRPSLPLSSTSQTAEEAPLSSRRPYRPMAHPALESLGRVRPSMLSHVVLRESRSPLQVFVRCAILGGEACSSVPSDRSHDVT